jgi:hypothetical protein
MQFLIESGIMSEDADADTVASSNTQRYPNGNEDTTKRRRNSTTREDRSTSSSSSTHNQHPNEIPDTAIIPSYESAQQFYKSSAAFVHKMWLFSGKIKDQMEANGSWLLGNLQDDFASRTVASAQRIVDQMPKTAALFTKVWKEMTGHDNDPDDK